MQNNFKKFQKTPFFFSIAFLGLACFVFIFLNKEIKNNHRTSEELLSLWQIEANRREEMTTLDKSLKANEAEIIELNAHFIQSSDIVPLLDIVERAGLTAGVKAEVSSVDVPQDKSSLVFEVKATGRFDNMYKFFRLLENFPYELQFISVEMQKSYEDTTNKKNSFTLWSGTFEIKLLSFVP